MGKFKLKQWLNKMSRAVLIGEIKAYAGSNVPTDWLVCDGSAVSRATYSALYSVIGTTYGSRDGSTTFNLPDFKGRTAIGAGESSATGHAAHTLGQSGGEETHKLTVDDMPSHNHNGVFYYDGAKVWNVAVGGAQGGAQGLCVYGTGSGNHTITTPSKGSDGAHNNMQPYTCINYIIYTGISG
jgi:microcystin-dependent protein